MIGLPPVSAPLNPFSTCSQSDLSFLQIGLWHSPASNPWRALLLVELGSDHASGIGSSPGTPPLPVLYLDHIKQFDSNKMNYLLFLGLECPALLTLLTTFCFTFLSQPMLCPLGVFLRLLKNESIRNHYSWPIL